MASPVTAADLTAARTAVESLMIESVTIKRPAQTKSATGANLGTNSAGVVTVCRKRDLPSDEQETANQLEPVKVTEFLFPHGTDVRTQDQLTIGSEKWEVIEVEKRSTLVQQRALGKKAAA
jgi:hypothetical protein